MPEHPLIRLVQQLAAPVGGGFQRPMPDRRQPVTGHQQAETVVDPIQQLGDAKRLHPRRRQLDRQRHPVQPRHQPGDHRAGVAVQHKAGIGAAGAFREQHHRL
jgi:hypothetical protein